LKAAPSIKDCSKWDYCFP